MDWNQHMVKDFGILAMPFTFKDLDAVRKFQQGEIYKELKSRMISERGVRIIADNWYRLPKVIVTKRPIKSLEDLKGLNMRMPSMKTYFDTWKHLGAKPTTIAWSEAFLALKKGVVDGMDSPLGSIYGMKFYQAAPYITMTYHLVAPFNILVNEKKYQELSDTNKKILIDVGHEAGDYYTKLVEDSFKVDKEKMIKAGCQFIEIDTTPFIKASAEVAKKFEGEGMWKKGLFQEITEKY
jgi:TRAP-type C4-dicarboxylate transport system substrate-binding protein